MIIGRYGAQVVNQQRQCVWYRVFLSTKTSTDIKASASGIAGLYTFSHGYDEYLASHGGSERRDEP